MRLKIGGIILCGGQSSRMGFPKAWLPFGPELMLPRIARLLGEACDPVVVVAAPDQDLPPLPDSIAVVRDEEQGRGPLEGLLAGLESMAHQMGGVEGAYATSCDVPLLMPEVARFLCDQLGEHEIVVAREAEFHHPLAAVYRTSLAPRIRALLGSGQRSLRALFREARTLAIEVEALRVLDAELGSLENVNTPERYAAVAARCGYTIPEDVAARLGL